MATLEAVLPASLRAKPAAGAAARTRVTPIVPQATVAGRSLALVIAIMTFLACLTIGAVSIMARTAADWGAAVASEITIQVRPMGGMEVGLAAEKAAAIARAVPGITAAHVVSQSDSAALLEPWLGTGIDLSALPVPRLVTVEISRDTPGALMRLRERLQAVSGASLDDHRLWQKRLGGMAGTLIGLGLAVLALVLSATVLTVIFATRGAMASNREVVAVLDLVGAGQGFIAREFQQHFLMLGFRGALFGGLAAIATFGAAQWLLARSRATPAADQIEAMFGSLSIGLSGYAGAVAAVLVISVLTAVTSRFAVMRALRQEG